ncbi:MAG TPA: 3-deoxy-manno-octulosonate cytidylyltransferase [Rhodocyclaceae bacterium]|nr:3-deoxy-manno-octulosonate cytidylyltransferase [Rhodocyclaceae bacterium]
MGFRVVIPARYASTRLPGKPLADIAGKPMVVRVADAAAKSGAHEIWIATDDERIVSAAAEHGYRALITRSDHSTGTDRLAEVARQLGWAKDEIVVNVQGDEPLIDPGLIAAVAGALAHDSGAAIATVAHRLTQWSEFENPNIVKVTVDNRHRALYFSRAPIPWPRNLSPTDDDALPVGFVARRHVGIYAYRVGFLHDYSEMAPASIEKWESLEQLRALACGYAIHVLDSSAPPGVGVDTVEDLEQVRHLFERGDTVVE